MTGVQTCALPISYAKGSCLPTPESKCWIKLFQGFKDTRPESKPLILQILASIMLNNTLYKSLWFKARTSPEPYNYKYILWTRTKLQIYTKW